MKYGPWEIFNGGDCPLKEGERERAQVQDRETSRLDAEKSPPYERDGIRWQYAEDGDGNHSVFDIIAFRRVIEPKPVSVVGYAQVLDDEVFIYSTNVAGLLRPFSLTITGDDIKAEWVE